MAVDAIRAQLQGAQVTLNSPDRRMTIKVVAATLLSGLAAAAAFCTFRYRKIGKTPGALLSATFATGAVAAIFWPYRLKAEERQEAQAQIAGGLAQLLLDKSAPEEEVDLLIRRFGKLAGTLRWKDIEEATISEVIDLVAKLPVSALDMEGAPRDIQDALKLAIFVYLKSGGEPDHRLCAAVRELSEADLDGVGGELKSYLARFPNLVKLDLGGAGVFVDTDLLGGLTQRKSLEQLELPNEFRKTLFAQACLPEGLDAVERFETEHLLALLHRLDAKELVGLGGIDVSEQLATLIPLMPRLRHLDVSDELIDLSADLLRQIERLDFLEEVALPDQLIKEAIGVLIMSASGSPGTDPDDRAESVWSLTRELNPKHFLGTKEDWTSEELVTVLHEFDNLRRLDLSDERLKKVVDADLMGAVEERAVLQRLSLGPSTTDAFLAKLPPNLEFLELLNASQVTQMGMESLLESPPKRLLIGVGHPAPVPKWCESEQILEKMKEHYALKEFSLVGVVRGHSELTDAHWESIINLRRQVFKASDSRVSTSLDLIARN